MAARISVARLVDASPPPPLSPMGWAQLGAAPWGPGDIFLSLGQQCWQLLGPGQAWTASWNASLATGSLAAAPAGYN